MSKCNTGAHNTAYNTSYMPIIQQMPPTHAHAHLVITGARRVHLARDVDTKDVCVRSNKYSTTTPAVSRGPPPRVRAAAAAAAHR